jgi:hypothetical protein
MALSKLQSDILRLLAKNRSESSYLAGGLMLNKDGVPIEVPDAGRTNLILRKATEEPEVMPAPADFNAVGWTSDRP